MSSCWQLPERVEFDGKIYDIHCDFRDILEIFSYFSDPDLPDFLKWQIGLALFYEQSVPEEHQVQAMEYMSLFLSGGKAREQQAGPQLIDWEQDADLIAADINKAAGTEIRSLPFLHWWTFLSWFHAIGEGQLSTVVSIRSKLSSGKKLENWEKEFYRENKSRVELKKRCSRQELQQKNALEQILQQKEGEKFGGNTTKIH